MCRMLIEKGIHNKEAIPNIQRGYREKKESR
jgi:hypothetical protein